MATETHSIDDNDAEIDAYHEGWDAYTNRNSLPYEDGSLASAWKEGKRDAERASRVRGVMPARPEGYYHTRLQDF